MYTDDQLRVNQCRSKSPTECCAWLTLFLSTIVAWDMAPEYNFAISIFGLVAVRKGDTRLISYMALVVPLLAIADFFFYFLATYSEGLFSFIVLTVMFALKIIWTFFAARLMYEVDGTFLAFFDCFRGTINWFRGLPSDTKSPDYSVQAQDLNGESYQNQK